MKVAVLVAGLACGAACGSSGPGSSGPDPGVTDPSAARSAVDAFGIFSMAMSSMTGTDAVSGVGKLMVGTIRLVTPTGPMPSESLRSSLPADGTVTCDATSCTFDDYGSHQPYSAHSLDGTIVRSDDTYTLQLRQSYSSRYENEGWRIVGAVTATATQLDGTLYLGGDCSQGSLHSNLACPAWVWGIDFTFMGVELDAQRCPIGGSVYSIARFDIEDDTAAMGDRPFEEDFYLEGTVSFGPACGDVR